MEPAASFYGDGRFVVPISPPAAAKTFRDQMRNGYYAIGEKVGQAWNAGAGLMK